MSFLPNFFVPEYVLNAIDTIERAGYCVYMVGGCVRDLLLNRTPKDYDLCSNAPCEDIMQIFEKTIPTGIKHGTVTVIINHNAIEITRMRTDGDYSDFRRPDSVAFTDDITADLSRRDFTINAMAMNSAYDILDPFEGQADLKHGIIRCAGDPKLRFSEDALRILRALRFAARLNFHIEPATIEAAVDLCANLQSIAPERIFSEIREILASNKPEVLDPVIMAGGLEFLHIVRRSVKRLGRLDSDLAVRIAALCHLCGTNPNILCTRLRTNNHLKTQANSLYEHTQIPLPRSLYAFKAVFFDMDKALWMKSLEIRKEMFDEYDNMLYNEVKGAVFENHPVTISELNIGGDDLIALGIHGRDISRVLQILLSYIHRFPEQNNKTVLTEYAREIITE